MSERSAALLVGHVALLATFVLPAVAQARARGDEPLCTSVRIVPTTPLGSAWSAAISALVAETSRLPASECPDATISVRATRGTLILGITTRHGTAERAVRSPDALVPIVLGALASVPVATVAPTRDEAPAAPAPASPVELVEPPAPLAEPVSTPLPPPTPTSIGVDVAVTLGARYGAPTRVLLADVEGRFDITVNRWIFAATLRYAPAGVLFREPIAGYAYDEIDLGLGVGRRIDVGPLRADLLASASIVLMNEEADLNENGTGGDNSDVRLGVTARVVAPLGGPWSLVVAADGEVAPFVVATPSRVDARLPPMPTWTLGGRAGLLLALQ